MKYTLTITAVICVVSQCLLIRSASGGTDVSQMSNIMMADNGGQSHDIIITATASAKSQNIPTMIILTASSYNCNS